MHTSKNLAAAQLLLEARRSGELLAGLSDENMPHDAADAYAIQDIVTNSLGETGGWKVGARGPGMQANCAPLPRSLIYDAPAPISAEGRGRCAVEAEIAILLKQDLPPKSTAYTRAEVIAAVASLHPALEVVSSRFAATPGNPLASLADNLSNGALVVGLGRTEEIEIDQTGQAVELYFDAEQVVAATGGNPVGDIWELLTWLANHAAMRCGGLRKGQFITTGSCTGLTFAKPGTRVKAVFPGLGVVELLVE
ncbi:2-keto-4-pentenoate hydratase [Undibacterium sp.]|uniref:2-keto-4-pentenoate hydratase n=1 Tax=Undibacterium sp. TaxID=1914977 RepID=UPI002C2211C7|nr:fumarylacetoacetate hydrolase family protein [Undibacterium sp.]HTD03797.1 fumarylacetoacetate hydrolase family protein [Undibacterium sp.]